MTFITLLVVFSVLSNLQGSFSFLMFTYFCNRIKQTNWETCKELAVHSLFLLICKTGWVVGKEREPAGANTSRWTHVRRALLLCGPHMARMEENQGMVREKEKEKKERKREICFWKLVFGLVISKYYEIGNLIFDFLI